MERVFATIVLLFNIFSFTQSAPSVNVLFVNDFSTNFVERQDAPSYSQAGQQVQFTVDVVKGVRESIPMDTGYHAFYNPDKWMIFNSGRENFPSISNFGYQSFAADGPSSESLSSSLERVLRDHHVSDTYGIIVLFTAAPKEQIIDILPMNKFSKLIIVGLNGANYSEIYSESVAINDFSDPARISCFVEVVYDNLSGSAPYRRPTDVCKPRRRILFVNDFTTNFVPYDIRMKRAQKNMIVLSNSWYGICPGNSYPEAGNQFNYTVDVIANIQYPALTLQYYAHYGSDDDGLDTNTYNREAFAEGAWSTCLNFCLMGPEDEDMSRLSDQLARAGNYDLLVIFTAASATDISSYFPLRMTTPVVAVGLNGADLSTAYPASYANLADFSDPTLVSNIINRILA